MKFTCPNKNTVEWKSLVAQYGPIKAFKMYIKNDYNIPVIEKEVTDKMGLAVAKALEDVTRRLKILESNKVAGKSAEVRGLRQLHDELLDSILNETHIQGLLNFAKEIEGELKAIEKLLENKNKDNIRNRASNTRKYLSFIDSSLDIIDSVTKFLVEKKDTTAEEKEIYDIFSSKNFILKKRKEDLLNNSRDIFMMFLTPFLGERNDPKLLAEINKNLPEGKKLKEFDLMTALIEGDKDIGFIDRWMKSMSNSRSDVLKIVNESVQRAKQSARLSALTDRYDLIDIRDEYFKSGGKDFNWVYEKRRDGTITGNFLSDRRYSEYVRDYWEFRKQLIESYGKKSREELTLEENVDYTKKHDAWINERTTLIPKATKGEMRVPNMKYYANEDYAKLTDQEKRILTKITRMKRDLDKLLHPKHRHEHRVPQVGKDLFERVKSFKNITDVREAFKEMYANTDYEVDMGDTSNTTDAEITSVLGDRGNEVELLPIHFTKKMDNMESNLSLDIISSMVAYSHMARDYGEMNKIVDILEIGREVLKEQKVKETDFQGRVKKVISYVASSRVEENLYKKTNTGLEKYEDWLSMIVYGKLRVKGKEISMFGKTIETEKIIDNIGTYTAINSLALNVFSGMSNVIFGEAMLRTEAIAGRQFGEKNVIQANIEYAKNLPEFLSKHGNVHNTSKLALWGDTFDTLQDYQSDKYEVDSMRRTWFARSMKMSSLFFLNSAGEHFMQTRSSLALAYNTKLKDKDGKEISLWDAYEVKDGRLSLKDGVTKLDGSKWTNDDIINFTRRQDYINQRMHGIYNQNDKVALQKFALGRIAMMFRKFILPGWDRRWEPANFNYMLGEFNEGYYQSTGIFLKGIFLKNIGKDLNAMQFSVAKNWNNLSDLRKANVRKTLTELSFLIGTMIVIALIGGGDSDDDWLASMAEYQARRFKSELLFYTNPNEALKIVGSPAASMSALQNAINFAGDLFTPLKKIESGRYEDWYKWQRDGIKILPMWKTIDRAFHPEEAVRWWK